MKSLFDIRKFKFYLLVGLAYLSLWLFIDGATKPKLFQFYFFNEVWRAIYVVVVNYFFYEYTLRNLTRKRIFRSFLMLAFQIFLYSFGLYLWRSLGIVMHIFTPLRTFPSAEHAVGEQFSASIFSIIFFGALKHLRDYRKLKESAQQLRIEKQEAELNYLKSQTNPHFLFNTLNNIYALARDKSDLAPESIMRLSKMLRYMLYETGGEYIAIEQELKIISDYIALEKLRYDKSLRVNFNYDIEDMKQALPPLLLIPLVENAFKHGVSETRSQPFVEVHLSVKSRQLTLLVKNSAEGADREVRENIGLSNLRRQLELQYSEYHLSAEQKDGVFTAMLKINLASHV